jgi:ABC-type long-subunit fatty acid transport system fused permease/ATPase subunit
MLHQFFCHRSLKTRLIAYGGAFVFIARATIQTLWMIWWNKWIGQLFEFGGEAVAAIAAADAAAAGRVVNTTGERVYTLAEGRAHVWAVMFEIMVYTVIRGALVMPLISYLQNRWQLLWRLTLIECYLHRWNIDNMVENAGQRVHEDTQKFVKGLQKVCQSLLESMFRLFAFMPILTELGRQVAPPPFLGGKPGVNDLWLVSLVFIFALGGLGVSTCLGKPLVSLEVANQRVEADLRKKLVLLETTPLAVLYSNKGGDVDGDGEEEHHRNPPSPHATSTVAPAIFPAFLDEMRSLLRNYLNLYRSSTRSRCARSARRPS